MRSPRESGLEIVAADDVAVAYTHGVFLEARKDVVVEIVAGQHSFLKPIALLLDSLSVRVVNTIQEVGNPRQFVLHGADL